MHARIIYVLLIEVKQFAILFYHSQISNYVVNNQVICTNNLNITVYTFNDQRFFHLILFPVILDTCFQIQPGRRERTNN